MVDARSIGAGGGSLARVDAAGILRVGPESAGADPGPACYRRGGTEPTVTDANAVLGRLAPEFLLAGDYELDFAAAAAALDTLAARLGLTASASPRASSPSQTTTWRRRCGSSRPTAGTTRAAPRSSPTAAPGRSTPASSPAPCRCAPSSCRATRALSPPSARSSPTPASTTRRPAGCGCGASDIDRVNDSSPTSSGRRSRSSATRASARRRCSRARSTSVTSAKTGSWSRRPRRHLARRGLRGRGRALRRPSTSASTGTTSPARRSRS